MESEEQASRDTGRADARDRAARIGRRIGIGVYLTILVYVVSVGFATFIHGIFLSPANADVSEASCPEIRRELAARLRERASAHVAGDTAATPAFFQAFDARLDSVRDRCGDPESARLERTRHRVELTLHRFDRENAAAFARLGADSPSLPHEETPR